MRVHFGTGGKTLCGLELNRLPDGDKWVGVLEQTDAPRNLHCSDCIQRQREGHNTPRKTNEEFVSDLMNYSPYGALVQPFILQAIAYYSSEVIKEGPEHFNSAILNGEAWVGIAQDIMGKLKERGLVG